MEDSVVFSSAFTLVPPLSPETRVYETKNLSFPFSLCLKEVVFLWQEFWKPACRCYKFNYLRNYFSFDTNIKFFHHTPYQILKHNFLLNIIEIQCSCHKIDILIEIILEVLSLLLTLVSLSIKSHGPCARTYVSVNM